jgi:hypothetical protein
VNVQPPLATNPMPHRETPGMRVTWLVSPNGLGHARRATLVAAALLRARPDLSITMCGEAWQRDRLGSTLPWVTGLLADAPRWPARPGQDLLAWRARVASAGVLEGAELVISDNLAGVLALRADAVLVGSFLWSDVLAPLAPQDAGIARFVADERALVARHRPTMICVEALAMPGVMDQTHAVPVPFMSDTGETWPAAEAGVELLGGASGAADDRLSTLARATRAAGVTDVRVTPTLGTGLVAVCRPGVGTISDCLAAGRPMLLLGGDDSLEMQHNAERLVALGVARPLPDDPDQAARVVADLVRDRQTLAAMTLDVRRLPSGGIAAAAAHLAARLPRTTRKQQA